MKEIRIINNNKYIIEFKNKGIDWYWKVTTTKNYKTISVKFKYKDQLIKHIEG